MPGERPFAPIQIDVGSLVQRSVATLYSHLVTRPTGRAVRQAIESLLDDAGDTAFSLIDLSEVSTLDFSCADEVVAQLLEGSHASRTHEAFFVFRGVHEPHRDQIETVLERRGLAAVAETAPEVYQLLGKRSEGEERMWAELERRGFVGAEDFASALPDGSAVQSLVERRLAFRSPTSGRIHALSRLARRMH